ncbi:hypothetical protein LTR37_017632 [Vermiconidia calcicola]|uniref:Uncharacterized protein n=1 Tax=Vermiconidia calcicola TaxID=1690605 RepID=A0ACC3MJA9_9PEZI|nr:hypothetical protein LTR37_017632 [Vermiconidia calcicola]
MRTTSLSLLFAVITAIDALPKPAPKPVSAKALEQCINESALSKKAHELEDLAYSTRNRNRVMGSRGHNLTIDWITSYLDKHPDYYTYEVQPFTALYSRSEGELEVDDEDQEADIFEYSPSGDVEANIVAVANLGCEASDYPDGVADNIALISRGECEFGLKSALAGAAGAVGAIIYNDVPGPIGGGTLGPPPRPEGEYVPTVGIAMENGTAILDALDGAGSVEGEIEVESDIRNITTYNVIAETIGGDHDNVLTVGAHSDSVFDGPGMNDDGSGSIGILEVAMHLAKYTTSNAVRFCWWSGEEFGLLGSTAYVETLNQTASELDKIRLYLNFDMIASPNYVYAIYDGDGSRYGIRGPPGSAQLEHFWEDWFDANNLNHTATAFDGRSDYQAFIDSGIPSGGLFTGADEVKTRRQVRRFGGVAGEILDQNYHTEDDDYANLNFEAFVTMTKAIAASVAEYATSFESIPGGNAKVKREVRPRGQGEAFVVKGGRKMWKL